MPVSGDIEPVHILDEELACPGDIVGAEKIVEGNTVVGIGLKQGDEHLSAVCRCAQGVVFQGILSLVVESQRAEMSVGSGTVGCCPSPVGNGLVEYAQVFHCRRIVASHEIGFGKSLYHAHVAVVGREHAGEHGLTLCHGHVSKDEIQFCHHLNLHCTRLRPYLI